MGSSKPPSRESIESQLANATKQLKQLERTLQDSRLESEAQTQLIRRLTRDLHESKEKSRAQNTGDRDAHMEALFTDLASAVGQIMTQAHLSGQGQTLQVEDVVNSAMSLISQLKERGLETYGNIGERAQFDANRHIALQMQDAPQDKEEVTIKVPGVMYNGKILRRAYVTANES
jgi:molecular chaperone GrpE (heat shock protein)